MKFTESDIKRFLNKVGEPNENGCMLWEAAVGSSGYGQFSIKGILISAHRFAFELHKGRINDDLIIRHSCDVKTCVNPEHLLAGTHADNSRDAIERGRTATGEDNGRSKLSCSDVKDIREMDDSLRSIARSYPVSAVTIGEIKRCEIWKSCGTYCKD